MDFETIKPDQEHKEVLKEASDFEVNDHTEPAEEPFVYEEKGVKFDKEAYEVSSQLRSIFKAELLRTLHQLIVLLKAGIEVISDQF